MCDFDKHPGEGVDVNTGAPAKTSAGKFCGWNTIFGREGDHATPYMTRIWFGRLRLHIFHRGDADPDCHDHPWDFWTFPLTPYVEEVVTECEMDESFFRQKRIVPAWRLTFRPAEHCHRVLGRYLGPPPKHDMWLYGEGRIKQPVILYGSGRIVTLVWRGTARRKWGFRKERNHRWCWVAWKEYVFGGGKSAPCE